MAILLIVFLLTTISTYLIALKLFGLIRNVEDLGRYVPGNFRKVFQENTDGFVTVPRFPFRRDSFEVKAAGISDAVENVVSVAAKQGVIEALISAFVTINSEVKAFGLFTEKKVGGHTSDGKTSIEDFQGTL